MSGAAGLRALVLERKAAEGSKAVAESSKAAEGPALPYHGP